MVNKLLHSNLKIEPTLNPIYIKKLGTRLSYSTEINSCYCTRVTHCVTCVKSLISVLFGDKWGKDAILFTTNNKISVGKKEGDNAIMFPDLSVWCMKPFVTLSDTVRWETGDMVDGMLSREYACKQDSRQETRIYRQFMILAI